MAITDRTIDHYLLEAASLAASGDRSGAVGAINDLGDTLVALVADQYPKGAVVDGKKVGGQFMPGKEASIPSLPGNAAAIPSALQILLKILSAPIPTAFRIPAALFMVIALGGIFAKEHWDEILEQIKKGREKSLLDEEDPAKIKPDWDTSGREEGDKVLAEAGLTNSVDDLAKEMYQYKDEDEDEENLGDAVYTLPRRRAAMNLLKRRDEVGRLSQELSEASDAKKKEELTKQIAWRVGMIKAEERFGQYVNKASTVSSGGYDGLITELKKNSEGKKSNHPHLYSKEWNFNIFAEDFMRDFMLRVPGFEPLNDYEADEVMESVSFIDSMTDVDLSGITIGRIKGNERAFFAQISSRRDPVAAEGQGAINAGLLYPKRDVLMHETAHAIEIFKKQSQTSAQFVKDRDKEFGDGGIRPLRDFNSNYPRDEKSYWDNFIDPYVGKVYEESQGAEAASEVVSMGIQHLERQSSLSYIATQDREHLMYALSVISK